MKEVQFKSLPEAFRDLKAFTPVAGKKPLLSDWPNNPLTINEIIQRYGNEPKWTGVGLLHKYAHTVAFDIDAVQSCRENLPERYDINIDDYLDPAKNCLFTSPNDQTGKAVFARPEGFDLDYVKMNYRREDGSTGVAFELRGDGCQDVAPGSAYPGGGEYTHAGLEIPPPMPQALLDMWTALSAEMARARKTYNGNTNLRLMNGDMQSVIYNFNLTYSIEEVLSRAGYDQRSRSWLSPNSESKVPGVIIFESHTHPYDLCLSFHGSDGDLQGRAVDAFEIAARDAHPDKTPDEAKSQFAKDMAKELSARDPETLAQLKETIQAWNTARAAELLPEACKTFKYEPTAPALDPGLIFPEDDFGELVRAFMDGANRRDNPVAAMVAAISMVATIGGGAYETSESGRTNMEIVCVGKTSDGKTTTLKQMRRLLPKIKEGYSVYSNISSWEGVEDELREAAMRPDIIFYLDEIGTLFKKMLYGKGEGIKDWLMRVWSEAGDPYVTRTSKAAGQRLTMYGVHVTVIGSSTVENLQDAIDHEDAKTGSTLRKLFFNCSTGVKKKTSPPKTIPSAILNRLKQIEEASVGRNQHTQMRMESPILVQIDKDAYAEMNQIDDTILEEAVANSEWRGKWIENALKVAACRAIYLNPREPVITLDIFNWATAIVGHSIEYTRFLFDHSFSLNRAEKARKDMLRVLAKNGGDMTMGQLNANSNYYKSLPGYEKQSLLKETEAFGWIKTYQKKATNGRDVTRVRLISNGEDDE